MDEKEAREVLGNMITLDNGLSDLHNYIGWKPGCEDVILDGLYNVEELEAIAWWMKNKGGKGED